jgi:hypothetical protein
VRDCRSGDKSVESVVTLELELCDALLQVGVVHDCAVNGERKKIKKAWSVYHDNHMTD